jgi:hypothetical protein
VENVHYELVIRSVLLRDFPEIIIDIVFSFCANGKLVRGAHAQAPQTSTRKTVEWAQHHPHRASGCRRRRRRNFHTKPVALRNISS